MITEHDLQEAIAECEGQRNPSSSTCMKLAAFYTIRDKMFPEKREEDIPMFYSKASEPKNIEYKSGTEFSNAISGMSAEKLIPIMDELMTAVQVISPRLYDGVMRKITE